jgi:hypothetical protein
LRVVDDRGWRIEMIGTSTATLRLGGSGEHLRLRVAKGPDPLANVRECSRASVAVEKALGGVIRDALASGHSWAEVGQALGVEANTSAGVGEQYETPRRWMRTRFWGADGEERDEARTDVTGPALPALHCYRSVRGRHGSSPVRLRRRLLVQASSPQHLALGHSPGATTGRHNLTVVRIGVPAGSLIVL